MNLEQEKNSRLLLPKISMLSVFNGTRKTIYLSFYLKKLYIYVYQPHEFSTLTTIMIFITSITTQWLISRGVDISGSLTKYVHI